MSEGYRPKKPEQGEEPPENSSLCDIVRKESESYSHVSKRRIAFADTCAAVTYSLGVGTTVDYFATGIRGLGLLVSRAYALSISALTGSAYGWWREKVFDTTGTDETSSRRRKVLSDLLAMNTFQTNLYTTIAIIGTYASDGEVNWYGVSHGISCIVAISPLVSATMNWWIDRVRKWLKVPPASAKPYKQAKALPEKKD